ncbi:MAG TPA: heat-inducible transcriptional repressor HrcA [Gemmatimonadota bacterium]|jgi:heat-inducible transcriptional repressor|nr:heat-inducible transcriptional repressor HrcA [Gemmatimonadota bacterium]
MMAEHDLNEREALVLEAVVRTFVQTASPAASRTVARQFDLGVSPATIRNTMSDLTRKGYLTQPHASAGRMPTDKAYRYYVDTLMRPDRLTSEETRRIEAALDVARTSAEERILARAVKALSVVTQELGVGLAPRMEEGVLEKIDLVGVSRDRLLIVLTIRSGPVRTIFVEGERADSDEALGSVAGFLNERLAGQTLREIRETYRDRLADGPVEHADLLNIFLEQAEGLFSSRPPAGEDVLLGPTAGLAAQPEFADREHLRTLLQLTEQRDVLAEALRDRRADGIVISIGGEHAIPPLVDFSMVTAEYEMGSVHGTIGVIGPTRMPYDRMVSLVEYTARLLSTLTPD